MRIEKPGIYFDIPSKAYFDDPCPRPSLTQSLVKVLLDQSPRHAQYEHPRLAPQKAADEEAEKYVKAQAIGNAVHAVLIGRGKELAIGDFDSWRSKGAQLFKANAEAAGKTPILAHHYGEAQRVVNAARLQLDECGWTEAFRAGRGEVVLAWEEDGLWFRAMIDWLSPDKRILTDLKTTGGSFAPHIVGRVAVDAGWDIQAAMYERGLNRLDPDNSGRRKFRFAALENYEPYALVPVELSETWLTMGRKKLEVAIHIWRDAMTQNRFEAYPTAPIVPEYPGYRENEWLTREQTFHDNLQSLTATPTDLLSAG